MAGPFNALNISETGYVVFDGVGTFNGRTLQAGTGIAITNGSGLSGNTTISSTVTGGVTSVSGTANQVAVANGTTNAVVSLIGPYTPATYTAHGLLVGEGTSSIAALGTGSAGQIVQSGGASADPSYSTATYPSTATGTGKILIADGTNWVASTPTYPATAGSSGNILTSDGTNWLSSPPASTGFSVVEVTGTSQAVAVNTIYIANNGSLVTFTMPSTFALGAYVKVIGKGAGGWKMTANTGDFIQFGNTATSSGGTIASSNRYDCMEFTGTTANDTWTVSAGPQGADFEVL